jgi:DNA repair protein SbcD/Mre11
MLLGIFSDTHLGFGDDERYIEAFDRFDESIAFFKEKNVDYILHAGDLFDHAIPTQEVWHKTMECFNKNNSKITTLTKTYLEDKFDVLIKGIPIIAIHGTHEFRGKDFSNALAVLEEANCLLHLHAGNVKLVKNEEEVYVHGMGGVPEKHAKMVLAKYNPCAIENKTNLLLLHQSFKEFLPFNDDSIASLSLSDLPDGFDLIIDGHLHWTNEQKVEGKRFLLTGSTIFTQMKKLESEKGKGCFVFNTETKDLEFFPFKNQRKLFYEKIKFKAAQPEEVIEAVNQKVKEIFSDEFEIKPLVRFKLVGTLAKGFSQKDVKLELPLKKGIFSITKKFESELFKKQIDNLKELQKEKKGVIEMGINILEKNVEDAKIKIDTRRLFDLLAEGEIEKAEVVLTKE